MYCIKMYGNKLQNYNALHAVYQQVRTLPLHKVYCSTITSSCSICKFMMTFLEDDVFPIVNEQMVKVSNYLHNIIQTVSMRVAML